ncbi:MAG: peptide ABC transporter substrate-binding protein [Cyanobacteria bacterium P01_F01_bin.86]
MNTSMVGRGRYLSGLMGAICLGLAAIAGSCSQPPNTTNTDAVPETDVAPDAIAIERDEAILRILYSRVPVTLNPHLATGIQDFEAGRIVLEPLATTNDRGELIPVLAASIPTVTEAPDETAAEAEVAPDETAEAAAITSDETTAEAEVTPDETSETTEATATTSDETTIEAGVAPDGKSVVWKLRSDIKWSDGTPFTAEDVVFTYEFVHDEQVGAATAQYYEAVESVEALDKHTIKITFKEATGAWQIPFTGQTGVILPKHIFESADEAATRQSAINLQPVGTGPYRVTALQPGMVLYEPNPNYRDTPPSFKGIELIGGIAPYAAAREVLSTGAADFAHNLQVEVDLLEDLQAEGKGTVVPVFGGLVERIMLNPTDPFAATASGERSSLAAKHPFLSDQQVRQAIAYAIDRDTLTQELYGFMGEPTGQLLVAPKLYANPGTVPYEYDLAKANALLDEIGWVDTDEDGIRDRDGIPMKVVFQTSVNPVRQKTQTSVKDSLKEIGIEVEIKRIRVDDFFSADPTQTNSINHFYADLQAYTTGNDHPDPTIYLSWWTCNQIANQANQWQKPNNARYCNAAYDELWQAATQELIPEKRAALFQEMDALLAEDVAVIPIVHRAITNAVNKTVTGIEPTPWDTSTWDIARWQRVPSDKVSLNEN